MNPTGKRNLVFNRKDALDPTFPVEIPCGQCIGCRLERSRQWAIRCVHEASLYEENCFLTLTYSPENLPVNGSLDKSHFQKFMKRLRKRFPDRKIRYFQCGEYGDLYQRPHYHACLFNFDFPDKQLYKVTDGIRTYTSELLEEIWGLGFCIIGSVTFESAAYVARYITKKITGEKASEHYGDRQDEYVTMSRRPGIATDWFNTYKDDVFPSDFIVINGKKVGVPKFYDGLLEEEVLDAIKKDRRYSAYEHWENNTYNRLYVREQVQNKRFKLLKRSFEND